ncbi:MAG: ORF6N domain-containing protein [Verrucomicrobiota bacterium]
MPDELSLIADRIIEIRGLPVLLDSDLAHLYGTTTMAFNQAVTRNEDRFPPDFMFRIERKDFMTLISQNVISKSGRGGRQKLPRVFTEHGCLMASMLLKSDEAVAMSLWVIRAFIEMRRKLSEQEHILRKIAEIDQTLLTHDSTLRDLYEKLFPLLEPKPVPAKREIGFHTT